MDRLTVLQYVMRNTRYAQMHAAEAGIQQYSGQYLLCEAWRGQTQCLSPERRSQDRLEDFLVLPQSATWGRERGSFLGGCLFVLAVQQL